MVPTSKSTPGSGRKMVPAKKRAPVSKSTPSSGQKKVPAKKRKRRRLRPDTVAEREIRRYQKTTELFFAKSPIRKILIEEGEFFWHGESGKNWRWSDAAVDAIHVRAEDKLTKLLSLSWQCTKHSGRKLLHKKDLDLVKKITKDFTMYEL